MGGKREREKKRRAKKKQKKKKRKAKKKQKKNQEEKKKRKKKRKKKGNTIHLKDHKFNFQQVIHKNLQTKKKKPTISQQFRTILRNETSEKKKTNSRAFSFILLPPNKHQKQKGQQTNKKKKKTKKTIEEKERGGEQKQDTKQKNHTIKLQNNTTTTTRRSLLDLSRGSRRNLTHKIVENSLNIGLSLGRGLQEGATVEFLGQSFTLFLGDDSLVSQIALVTHQHHGDRVAIFHAKNLFFQIGEVVEGGLGDDGVDENKTLSVFHVQISHGSELFLFFW